ncbi:MAG: archaeal proteasome endopeptidase complex subunit alpha [Candidatus Lokiarchaeota archaeon]|nr:archaeal proteasome endopeptidase complex subunit alpha [Candidatus Lokiarchaeota archaeon]
MFGRGGAGAYDRVVTMFSPDGRLFQVEFALEAVRRGSLAVAIKSTKGAIIVVLKKTNDKLRDPDTIKKVFQVDDHIGCAISGLHADSRVLVNWARVQAQYYKLNYGESMKLQTLVRRLADVKQMYTQSGGIRPFGCAFILISVDPDGIPQLMTTSPSGRFSSWKATALGQNEDRARDILKENYKEDASLEDLMKLGIKVQKQTSEEEITAEDVEIAFVNNVDRKFDFVPQKKIKLLFNQA